LAQEPPFVCRIAESEPREILEDAKQQVPLDDAFSRRQPGELWPTASYGNLGDFIVQLRLFLEAQQALRVSLRGVFRMSPIGIRRLGKAD
jgi:hypothetical protein